MVRFLAALSLLSTCGWAVVVPEINPEDAPEGQVATGQDGKVEKRTKSGKVYVSDADRENGIHPHRTVLTGDRFKRLFELFDLNGDGKAPKAELLQYMHKMRHDIAFHDEIGRTAFDTNNDGKVSPDEVKEAFVEDLRNGTIITHEEALALMMRKFNAADKDGSGHLEESEASALVYPETVPEVLEIHVKDMLKRKDKSGDGLLSLEELWGHDAFQKEKDDFKVLDRNGDGLMDFVELKRLEGKDHETEEVLEEFLKLLDADADGHIIPDEIDHAKLSGTRALRHFENYLSHHRHHHDEF